VFTPNPLSRSTPIDGDSRPANPSRLSFLSLPGELRNEVYDLLLTHPTPIRVVGSEGYILQPCHGQPHLDSNTTNSPFVRLFLTCRQVHQEAASRFFKNNTIAIATVPRLHDPAGKFINILIPLWLSNLGHQAYMVTKLIIDLDALCPLSCTGNYGCPSFHDVFDESSSLIEVHHLLRTIWEANLDIDITILQPHGKDFTDLLNWRHPGGVRLSMYDCNNPAITQILQSLIEDQLDLRKYGRLLGRVGIKRDGSGGAAS
jgi:hypothetical protein